MVFTVAAMVKFTRSFGHGTYNQKGLEQVAKRLFNAKPMEKGIYAITQCCQITLNGIKSNQMELTW
jgi:hypothetical protein